jgi:hypothetical protein
MNGIVKRAFRLTTRKLKRQWLIYVSKCIALLFCFVKAKWTMWLQGNDPGTLNRDEFEIVGSEGGRGLDTSARMVFGGVVKGAGLSEHKGNGGLLLRKCGILLGPF